MRKGGGGVGELRSAIKDKVSHVFLRGVSWSVYKEESKKGEFDWTNSWGEVEGLGS